MTQEHRLYKEYVIKRMRQSRNQLHYLIPQHKAYFVENRIDMTDDEIRTIREIKKQMDQIMDDVNRIVNRTERDEGEYLNGPTLQPSTRLLKQMLNFELAIARYETLEKEMRPVYRRLQRESARPKPRGTLYKIYRIIKSLFNLFDKK